MAARNKIPPGFRLLRARLSLLMFLQYAAAGAIIPLYTLRLQELVFSPRAMAWVCATQAMAGLITPLAGQIADRWLPAERCLAVLSFLAGILMWMLATLTTPATVFAVSLATWMLYIPCVTWGTSICFTHLRHPDREFGPVRLWGTVGWIAPSLTLSVLFEVRERLSSGDEAFQLGAAPNAWADIFRLGAILAWALAVYALTLPHTPPHHRLGSWLAPLAAISLLRSRSFAVYLFSTFGLCVCIPFAQQVMPLLLAHLGIPRPWLLRILPIAQVTEIIALGLLPMILLRLNVRGSMFLGLAAWTAYMVALALGQPTGLVVTSLTMNGICVCCFLVAGQVFVNRRARGDIRTSAQALLTFTNSLGMLSGNLLVGWVRTQVDEAFPPTFIVAAVISASLLVVFALGFSENDNALKSD
jgi:MFS family permease